MSITRIKLFELLKSNSNFVDSNNELLPDKILSSDNRSDLIKLLLTNKEIKEDFFEKIDDVLIFKENEFSFYIKTRNYLKDSYTAFDNKIGFNNQKQLDNNVVLNFPYKDCVLEGGQTKDDEKRKEIFFNEILAKDEIKRLTEPKVLTNFEKYTINGKENFQNFTRDAEINKKRGLSEDTITDNLLVKGNNLLVLYSLVEEFRGKVKCIYIDPPYNTGNDSFNYNDDFNHSSWLCFMKNRLEIARELLKNDGAIFIQCDDNEQAYLKILCDEVFGRDNFYGCFIQLKGNTQNDSKTIQKNHEYVLCYVKTNIDLLLTYINTVQKEVFEDSYYLGRDTGASSGHDTLVDRNNLGYTIYYYEGTNNGATGNHNTLVDRNNLGYTIYYYEGTNNGATGNHNTLVDRNNLGYNDFKFFYKNNKIIHAIALKDYNAENLTKESKEEEIYKDDKYLISLGYIKIRPPKRNGEQLGCWTWGIETFRKLWNNNEVLIKNNKNIIKKEFVNKENIIEINGKKYYQKNNILPPQSIIQITNSLGTTELKELFNKKIFNNPKSEELLQHLIDISTKPNDIVLDFFAGSGTTGAVAHKMNRQWIMVEQMDYIETITKERMKKVIAGEQGGISKSVNWQGGGEFVYFELKKYNENFVDMLNKAETKEEVVNIFQEICKKGFVKYNIDIKALNDDINKGNNSEFLSKSIEEMKENIYNILNKNMLYVPLSMINDNKFEITNKEKSFNKKFYTGVKYE